ncbi:hypothetical protein QFZ98_004429 [Paraburkholderia youngii]
MAALVKLPHSSSIHWLDKDSIPLPDLSLLLRQNPSNSYFPSDMKPTTLFKAILVAAIISAGVPSWTHAGPVRWRNQTVRLCQVDAGAGVE